MSVQERIVELEAEVAAARAEVERQHQVLAEWEAKGAAATAELESLQERAGEDLLDNPDAEGPIARSMGELRDRIDLAERAVAAQRPRLLLAERRYLAAEADQLEPAVVEAEAELAAHEKKTQRLLGQLQEHEGTFVPEVVLINQQVEIARKVGVVERRTWVIPKSEQLRGELEPRRRQLAVLRAMAAGEDPMRLAFEWGVDLSSVLPPCVAGPGAVVPAKAYLDRVDRARALVAELEDLARRLPAEVHRWRQEQEAARPGERLDGLEIRELRLATLPSDLEQARAALADLTSEAK